MVEESSGKRFRELALECQEEAKRTTSAEVREGYMHMAQQWLKLADERDAFQASNTPGGLPPG